MDVYTTNLGNHDTSVREAADQDYVRFWDGQARHLHWFEPWSKTLLWEPPFARWFVEGTTNMAYNALDVHLETHADKPAIYWEGEDGASRVITYQEMHATVCRLANALESMGVRKGDRITLYMPMVPEIIVCMLACARIGAIHTVVFSGFSSKSLADRINDSGSCILITADIGHRRGGIVNLAATAKEALAQTPTIRHTIVFNRHGPAPEGWMPWQNIAKYSDIHAAVHVASTDPLFILYTSGTTGRPKGVLHSTGGYMTHVHTTFGWAFDIHDRDVYFCTADVGWVTGHSYVAYGPLLCGATQVMYEGALDYPDASRLWKIIERYGATILYTTPTALRMLMKFGDHIPKSHDLSTIRLLGSVGEPINPEVWRWYHDTIGSRRCPVIDTWWQTETGGMLISALPGIESYPLKPGSGTLPIPGLQIEVINEDGTQAAPNTKGYLTIHNPWPGMMLTLWKDDQKYRDTYWRKFPGRYYAGDYAMMDDDGYLWLLGRADDILKVSGHRIGTAELESCMVSHQAVAESAVVGIPDDIRGEGIVAFVVLLEGIAHDGISETLRAMVADNIGPIARPDRVYIVPALPKTRSGKIMRRLLRGMVTGENGGDVTTMEDASVLDGIRVAVDCQP